MATRTALSDGGVEMSSAPELGAIGISPRGTLVAVRGGWTNWYSKQAFYRSTDGMTWDVLPPSAFLGSHPMSSIIWGLAVSSTACP